MKEDKINIFNSYIKSIFDFNSYNFFHEKSLGRAFLYLFFLTILLGGLSIIRPMYNFNTMLDKFTTNYEKSTPEFNFKDGILDVSSDEPLIYGDPQMSYIVVDTSGKTTSTILNEYAAGMLVTKDHLYQKDILGNIKAIPLSTFKVLSFNKDSVEKELPNLKLINILLIIYYPIRFFIGYLLNALILSLIALSLKGFIRPKTTFKDFYKLSIYALTLSTTFNLIITSIDRSVPTITTYLDLIFYGVGLLYILKALTVIKLNEK
ncbi:MAG: DUF1189 domain-containing protein [Clostridiaceae bacterium]|nr:DUF1189 domain-containing protein [Clostridiaceae bacterium]